VAREIAKRKRKIKADIENAAFLHYPKEEVLGVLKFWGKLSRAHAPPVPNFQTWMPSFAFWPCLPVPGKTMPPIGSASSI
jgi:hypothetical protein